METTNYFSDWKVIDQNDWDWNRDEIGEDDRIDEFLSVNYYY